MSEFVAHEACPKCGSQDNLARYDDGHAHCFGCDYHEPATGETKRVDETPKDWRPISGNYQDLIDRGIREETLKFWKYQVGTYKGKPAHIMNWRDETGDLVGQKFRQPGKEFSWLGEGTDLLYGMWLWGKGKSITITEGELDALSVSQAFGNKWPVVSLPNGSKSVKKVIKRCYDYLMNFEKIVLMFDQDEPGHAAVSEAVDLLPAGKVYIATLPEKDANEVLKKHGPGKITDAFWNAKPYRPDGIISGADISLDELRTASTKGYNLRLPDLNNRLLGLRKGEITLWTAGSGIGKSTMLRQLFYEVHQDYPELTFGNVFLEENNKKTAQAYIALDNSVPLGRLRYNPEIITPEQWQSSYDRVVKERMWFYNHFGSLESERLISKLHYMATVLKVDFIALDHISIVTSGLESSSEGERKDIDILMTRLRQLVEETGVGIQGVVHLKRVKDKNFNEGGAVSLTDLRGSASLEQLSDNVVSLERDQQGDKKDVSLIRVLKCRETGDTGESDTVLYKRDTGRLVLTEAEQAFPEIKTEAVDNKGNPIEPEVF
jgi:twinkle protein